MDGQEKISLLPSVSHSAPLVDKRNGLQTELVTARVMAFLNATGNAASATTIQRSVKGRAAHIFQILKDLYVNGVLDRCGKGTKSDPMIYSLRCLSAEGVEGADGKVAVPIFVEVACIEPKTLTSEDLIPSEDMAQIIDLFATLDRWSRKASLQRAN